MKNYLLDTAQLPAFSKISASDVEPALDLHLQENRELAKQLIENTPEPNW